MRLAAAFLCLIVGCTLAHADRVLTPCELAANAADLDNQSVMVRGELHIEFEDSSFVRDCNAKWLQIWVTFAGDVETPVIYCCGPHERPPNSTLRINGIELQLKKDDKFQTFWRLLNEERAFTPTGVRCFFNCYVNRVTATFKGHFFFGEKSGLRGYGHMGCCSLFVIEEVSDVSAQHTQIPFGDDFECTHDKELLSVNKNDVIQAQETANKEGDTPTAYDVGENLVRHKMEKYRDDFDTGDNTVFQNGEVSTTAEYVWLSKNKLTSYDVHLQRPDWIGAYAPRVEDRVWVPIDIDRAICHPK